MAAKVARGSFLNELTQPDVLLRMETDPKSVFDTAFRNAHLAIETAFRKYYENAGWHVERAADGYLIRTKQANSAPMCVHGGTTATIAVILQGRRLIVANVGDSTAIICGLGTAGVLRHIDEWTNLSTNNNNSLSTSSSSSSSSTSSPLSSTSASTVGSIPANCFSSYMEVSADHSPESESEFLRMHKYRPHSTIRGVPELMFVYDTLTASKLSCPSIFEVHPTSGKCTKTERGSYYKNVRCEWATLVATPPHAGFQDALAFTRSLGDLHLQSYGVSHVPEIWWMDIVNTSSSSNSSSTSSSSTFNIGDTSPNTASTINSTINKESAIVPHAICLCVSSDGIWDNWKFEEVSSFLLTSSRLNQVITSGNSETAVTELMGANLDRARANFGSSADNMTAISKY